MTKTLAFAMAVLVTAAPLAAGEKKAASRAARENGSRLLKDAVATGTVEIADFATIAEWILHEKEEKVAAGLIGLFSALEPQIAQASGPRWTATTRALFSLFATTLDDARSNRRRSGRVEPEIAALLSAAAPAVIATLQEADPESRARMRAVLGALAPFGEEMTVLLGADVLGAARDALEDVERD